MDSQHTSGWLYPTDIKFDPDEMLHESVGFLYHETEYSYALIQSKSKIMENGQGQIDAMMEIPKCAVIELRELNA